MSEIAGVSAREIGVVIVVSSQGAVQLLGYVNREEKGREDCADVVRFRW
jgi:hypothetical protein